MEQICEACARDPLSHSFRKLSETEESVLFYTNPSRAILYKDSDGILNHYTNALNSIGEKKWRWIFDSDGFGWHHALEVNTGIGIAKLITSHFGSNLEDIRVINPSWHIQFMLMAVWPFLGDDTKQKIHILDDRYYSIVEFV